jgi:hypothetical protein
VAARSFCSGLSLAVAMRAEGGEGGRHGCLVFKQSLVEVDKSDDLNFNLQLDHRFASLNT